MDAGEETRARVGEGLKIWFRTPPRRHGEVEYSREVSFLELFSDLVYVVVVARAAHHLAEHVDWGGVRDFVILFGFIWLAWFNGTFWHELHAREDGRSRLYIFGQMGLLALLAVFANDAFGADGTAFAITYTILFLLFTWQWYLVHRVDTDPRYRPTTIRYLAGMVAAVVAMAASAFVPEPVRAALWALVVIGWVIGGFALVDWDHTEGFGEGVTGSLVERIGLFTIIVLGEVVVGVVAGMSEAQERNVRLLATGIVGLTIGMGMWWNYFDMLGRRVPGQRGGRLAGWLYAHLPMTMAIAASGAAMVSVVEHAADDHTPASTAWLLTGSVVVLLFGITVAARALPEGSFPTGMRRQVAPASAVAAILLLAVGALAPSPLVLAAAVSLVLASIWLWLFMVLLAAGGRPW
jgi:low temperature requirement protein LtrA